MKLLLVAPGFRPDKSNLQPWCYIDRVSRALTARRYDVSLVAGDVMDGIDSRSFPYELVSLPSAEGLHGVLSGRLSRASARWLESFEAHVVFADWSDLLVGRRNGRTMPPKIAMITSPVLSPREARNLWLSADLGLRANVLAALSYLSYRTLRPSSFASLDGVVVASHPAYEYVQPRSRGTSILLALSGIDNDIADLSRGQRYGSPETDRPIVTFCGPPRRERGFDLANAAARILGGRLGKFTFRLLLRPDDPRDVTQVRSRLDSRWKGGDAVKIEIRTDAIERTEFIRLMSESTVAVFPFMRSVSLTPISLLEAIALGVPVVTTPVLELASMVTASRGSVSSGFTPHAVAAAVVRVLRDSPPSATTAQVATESIPTWDQIGAEWAAFIGSVVR